MRNSTIRAAEKSGLALSLTIVALAGICVSVLKAGDGAKQAVPRQTATISGTVTADKSDVKAVRIKAKDTVRKIAYTVFTNKGGYHIFNLPAGSYEVSAVQDGFESTIQHVELTPGQTQTADLALTAKAPARQVELVDYDVLYPPGPGRDLLMRECGGCHGLLHIPWHRMAHRNEDGWRTAVNRMFEINRAQVPVVSPEAVSAAERESIIKYFAANFGEDSKPRDLKLDPLPLNEADLSQAIYVQYALPPPVIGANGQTRSRGMHDIFPSRVSSTVWFGDTGTGSILGLDLRNIEYPSRFREWPIPSAMDRSVVPHGIIEDHGQVYWAELAGTAIGQLDPATGTINRYLSPSKGSLHTLRADSKGNIWYTSVYGASKIGRLDAKTKTMKEWDPSPNYKNAHYYGLIVDKKDRVWAAGNTAHTIVGYDPQSDKWTTYPTPTPSAGPRRPTADSKGRIWFSEHLGDAIGMLDPKTGDITEYKSPFRHGGEYECYADAEDNIWLTLRSYDTLLKFDPTTKKYTYFPYPEIKASVPKIETDAQGTIWFADGRNLVSFKPKGNVLPQQTSMNLR